MAVEKRKNCHADSWTYIAHYRIMLFEKLDDLIGRICKYIIQSLTLQNRGYLQEIILGILTEIESEGLILEAVFEEGGARFQNIKQ